MDRAVGAESDGLVERAHGAVRAHGDRDDLVDLGVAAFADLHGGLDAVRVEWIQVLLAGAIEPLRVRIDPLLDGGVRNLFDEATDLQLRASLGRSLGCWSRIRGFGGTRGGDLNASPY